MPRLNHIGRTETNALGHSQNERTKEIVNYNPGILIRWGNFVFLGVLLALGSISWIIKYPEIVKTSAKLKSINSPKPIVSIFGGKLVKLSVVEAQYVEKGHVVGYMESTAQHEEILHLEAKLDSVQAALEAGQLEDIGDFLVSHTKRLGELQGSYQTLWLSFTSLKSHLSNGLNSEKKAKLLMDKEYLTELRASMVQQRELQEQDLALSQKNYHVNKVLNETSVISDVDFRNEQSKLINKRLTLPQMNSAIITNESQQNEKDKELLELENAFVQQKAGFQQELLTFKSHLQEWKKKYLLEAPIAGRVAFSSFIEENQQLAANQSICYLNPYDSEFFAEVIIPQENFGKVAVGQQVLLKFPSYPFQEFGIVLGKIESIKTIPSEAGYVAKVSLIDGLVTTAHKNIIYRDGLVAEAEIVTRDMRLLERFYYSIAKQLQAVQ